MENTVNIIQNHISLIQNNGEIKFSCSLQLFELFLFEVDFLVGRNGLEIGHISTESRIIDLALMLCAKMPALTITSIFEVWPQTLGNFFCTDDIGEEITPEVVMKFIDSTNHKIYSEVKDTDHFLFLVGLSRSFKSDHFFRNFLETCEFEGDAIQINQAMKPFLQVERNMRSRRV